MTDSPRVNPAADERRGPASASQPAGAMTDADLYRLATLQEQAECAPL